MFFFGVFDLEIYAETIYTFLLKIPPTDFLGFRRRTKLAHISG